MIAGYLSGTPPLLEEMERAASAGDADTLRRAAHTLKSTSASLGALRLSTICREIANAAPPATSFRSGWPMPRRNTDACALPSRRAGPERVQPDGLTAPAR